MPQPKIAVVGHVEWVEFAPVARVPVPGEIVEAQEAWEQAAGGGAVSAVQIARLVGECLLVTALGDDAVGHRAKRALEEMGLRVEAAWRPKPQRRAFVYLDADGERTITVIGDRLEPRADDPLPWSELERMDAIYLTAGDAGSILASRAARRLVATVRAGDALARSGVQLDVLVTSAKDRGEVYRPGDLNPSPDAVVRTDGASGGLVEFASGRSSPWVAAKLPGPLVDTYGAGDSFAGGLTYGLGNGQSVEKALALAARCGAACATGRGPYERQLGDSA